MFEKLDGITKRYNEISDELATEKALNDFNLMKKLLKEQKGYEKLVEKHLEYKKIIAQLSETKDMLNDPELHNIAREEMDLLKEKELTIKKELELMLLPKDENDDKNIMMEIRGAAGGDEANIFAGDLFRMYSRYIEKNNWKIEVLDEVQGSAGGYAQIEFMVKGENVYSKLKFESGSHRVQRVPETESQGRIHTSTATVLVMPEADDVNVEVREADIKVDVFHSSGAGGQSVNTADSAVRMTHIPSGIVVTCQTERSQLKNKERAMQVLKNKIHLYEIEKKEEEISKLKGNPMDINFGSQIRSYVMHPYSMVKDHRTETETSNVLSVLDGNIDLFIESYLKGDIK